jgi:hypothetical protein
VKGDGLGASSRRTLGPSRSILPVGHSSMAPMWHRGAPISSEGAKARASAPT